MTEVPDVAVCAMAHLLSARQNRTEEELLPRARRPRIAAEFIQMSCMPPVAALGNLWWRGPVGAPILLISARNPTSTSRGGIDVTRHACDRLGGRPRAG